VEINEWSMTNAKNPKRQIPKKSQEADNGGKCIAGLNLGSKFQFFWRLSTGVWDLRASRAHVLASGFPA
jgi:hypothetical protein